MTLFEKENTEGPEWAVGSCYMIDKCDNPTEKVLCKVKYLQIFEIHI